MRKGLLILVAVVSGAIFAGSAQAQVQIFGGYSYVHPTVSVQTTIICPGPPCPVTTTTTHPNFNGWEFAGTYNFFKVVGLTADVAGNYGTVQGAPVHLQTYLFGPQIHLPGPVSPFAHLLAGVGHETIGNSTSALVIPFSGNAFAAAAGGGIDIKVIPFVSLRVIQFDELVTRFHSTRQNQPRVSAGVVIHF